MKKTIKYILVMATIIPLCIVSCKTTLGTNDVVVQIWDSETMVSNGIVAGNGNQVLTIIDYKYSTPDNLYIVISYVSNFRHRFFKIIL